MASDCARLERFPGAIVSESPVMPEYASCGKPHSGPCTRGKRRNSTSAAGAACASSRPAERALALRLRCGALKPISVAVSAKSAAHISAAVGIDCV
jgi:hypothetical protein